MIRIEIPTVTPVSIPVVCVVAAKASAWPGSPVPAACSGRSMAGMTLIDGVAVLVKVDVVAGSPVGPGFGFVGRGVIAGAGPDREGGELAAGAAAVFCDGRRLDGGSDGRALDGGIDG